MKDLRHPCGIDLRQNRSGSAGDPSLRFASLRMTVSRRRRGFSLVETLVGLLILSFIVTTSLLIVLERERRLAFAAETIAAYQALSNEVEIQRHVSYDDLDPGEYDQFMGDLAIVSALADLKTHVRVEQMKPSMKKVTFTLQWRKGQRTASVAMIRTDTGGGNLW